MLIYPLSFIITVLVAYIVYILARTYMPKFEHIEIEKRLGMVRPNAGKELTKVSQSVLSFIESRIARIKGPGIEKMRAQIRKMLDMAGNPAGVTVDGYFAICVLTTFVMTTIAFMFLAKFDAFIKIIIGFFLGYAMPYMWLKGLITNRHRSIIRTLPDVLDLITLSMEAGIDFNAAVTKVVSKSEKSPLIEELALMQQGIRLGQSRITALEDMIKRVDNPDLTSVVTNIIQAEKISSPLATVLRIQSEQMRLKRFQLAEKLAQQAPIKMLFPLIFCILPSIFLMLFGPLMLRVFSEGLPF